MIPLKHPTSNFLSKKVNFPKEDKTINYSAVFRPLLSNFFDTYLTFHYNTFFMKLTLIRLRFMVSSWMTSASKKPCFPIIPIIKTDVFLAGIASQLTVVIFYRMNCPKYIRILKLLVT